MRTRIQRERRVELAFENWRYFDLRRWNKAQEELDGSKVLMENLQDNETPGKYLPHYDLWAIPQNVLNKNTSLKQNPGYN